VTDHTHLDLCPDCQGLRITELTSIGSVGISLDGGPDQPAELWIGPTPDPCDHAPAKPQPQHTIKVTELPVDLPRELAIDWGLIHPDQPIGPTPVQRALDILAPHLAWDPRYCP
jgi:hypothetical protein